MSATLIDRSRAKAGPRWFSYRVTLRISDLVDEALEFVATDPDSLRQEFLTAAERAGLRRLDAPMSPDAVAKLADIERRRASMPRQIARWAAAGESQDTIRTLADAKLREYDGREHTIRMREKRLRVAPRGRRFYLHVSPGRDCGCGWHNIAGHPAGFAVKYDPEIDWESLWEKIVQTKRNDERLSAFSWEVSRAVTHDGGDGHGA